MWIWPVIVLQGYLFGSISSSVLLSRRLYGRDVREYGSGNAGATNAARVFGMGMGLLTLACDALKTVAACLIGLWLGGEAGFALAGAACVTGHCWPVLFGFKGGKGVTVGAVLAALIDWRILLVLAAAFFALFFLSKRVSVCSMACGVLLPVLALAFGCPWQRQALALFTGLLVLCQHRGNLRRLLHGQEQPFHPGHSPKKDLQGQKSPRP